MMPRGGGLRILGIRELLVEDDPLDLVGKLANLVRIFCSFEPLQEDGQGFVGGIRHLHRTVRCIVHGGAKLFPAIWS